MKILIIIRKWEGGVGVSTKNVAREIEKKGNLVNIISREDDLKIYSLAKSIFKLRKKVRELMRISNYDIIYARDWSMAFPLIFPFPIFRKKLFSSFGGVWNLKKKGISGILQKFVGVYLGKRVISTGDTVKEYFPRATKIYNGVERDKFKPLIKIKRIPNSIGFANWKTDYYKYSEIESAAKKIGKKLLVAEDIPNDKMPEFYNKIETFISLPHSSAGFNMVWLEAMACGVPKIIGSNSGIGNRLPIDKIENFESIEKAILNAKKKNYRKLLSKKFKWENSAKELIKLWNKH